MSTNYLHSLKTKELLHILRHVELGKEHLLRTLSKSAFNELLSIGSLSNNQIDRIEPDKQEKIGNVSIVMNTILTSCFGAWLGFSAFNQSQLISVMTIFIFLAAIAIGPATGYLSYLLTHKQAELAYESQQLNNVKRIIIEIIINKRELAIEHIEKKTNHILVNLYELLNAESIAAHHYSAKQLFELIYQKEKFNTKTKALTKKLFHRIERNFSRLTQDVKLATDPNMAAQVEFDETDFMLNNALTNASYIKILAKADLTLKHQIPKVSKWLKKNALGICVGLLPTFLGSFASMFVFLNGVPAFLTGFGFDIHLSLFQIALLKKFALCAAISVSFYFAFSHIHSNYKAFKRAKQLEISASLIAEKNNMMLHLMMRFNLWTKIYYHLRILADFYKQQGVELVVLSSREQISR